MLQRDFFLLFVDSMYSWSAFFCFPGNICQQHWNKGRKGYPWGLFFFCYFETDGRYWDGRDDFSLFWLWGCWSGVLCLRKRDALLVDNVMLRPLQIGGWRESEWLLSGSRHGNDNWLNTSSFTILSMYFGWEWLCHCVFKSTHLI